MPKLGTPTCLNINRVINKRLYVIYCSLLRAIYIESLFYTHVRPLSVEIVLVPLILIQQLFGTIFHYGTN